MVNIMQIGAAYIRVSTEDQMEYSPDSQLKKIREYAASHGISLQEEYIFVDEGISGRSAEKRPGFMHMVALAKDKPRPFDVILLWKFSRFARNRQDSILYKSMLRKECGIDVVSITEQLSDDPTAILIEALLEAMDEYYSINLAQEVRRGMNEKFSRGGVVSVPPFGYVMGKEKFEIDRKNASFVRLMFEKCKEGMSCRQIAEQLNEMGVRSSRGNPFENRTVKYVLTNPVYTGKLRRNTKENEKTGHDLLEQNMAIVDGRHTPLVSQELFDEVQKRLNERKTSNFGNEGNPVSAYMLKGLVRCSNCGGTLVRSKKGESLQCCKYARGACNKSHSVTIPKINQAVIEQLKQDAFEHKFIIKRRTSESLQEAQKLLLEREYRRLEKVKSAYESGIDSLEEYRDKKQDCIRHVNKLKEKMEKQCQREVLPDTLIICMKEAIGMLGLEEMDEYEKNKFLKSFISKIVFSRENRTIQIYYHI